MGAAAAPNILPTINVENYILQKLRTEMLPWLIAGRMLPREWFARIGTAYGYINDFTAALVGLGIGTPIGAVLSGKLKPGESAIGVIRSNLPSPVLPFAVVLLIAWIVLKVYVQRENVLERSLLARDCGQQLRKQQVNLYQILSKPEPMPDILRIQETIDRLIDNAMQNKIWRWDPLPRPTEIEQELECMIDELRVKFASKWRGLPPGTAI